MVVHGGHRRVSGCRKATKPSSQTCSMARSIFCCWPMSSSRSFSTTICLPFMCSRSRCVSCSRDSKVLRMSWERQQLVVNRKPGGKFVNCWLSKKHQVKLLRGIFNFQFWVLLHCSMQFIPLGAIKSHHAVPLKALLVAPTWMSCCTSWISFLLFFNVSSTVLSCSSSFTFCLYSGPEAKQLELHHQD